MRGFLYSVMNKSFFPPVWSRQHGAYITLITCWVLNVILSNSFSLIQIWVILFLLAGFNFVELWAEKNKRKSPMPGRKMNWLYIYLLISMSTGVFILFKVALFLYTIPFFIGFGALFIFLVSRRMEKSFVAEWMIFAVFSLASCLAYNPQNEISWMKIASNVFLCSLYFGTSICTVKYRMLKMNITKGLIYVICSILILSFFYQNLWVILPIGIFMLIKGLVPVMIKEDFMAWPIPKIGKMEAVYHVLYVILIIVLRPLLIS